MKNNNILLGIAFAALIVVILVLSLKPLGETGESKETIATQGVGKVTTIPDLVSVMFAVETLADSAEESEQENARIMSEVRTELLGLGLDESEIQTSNFNVYPDYDWTQNGQKLKGYKTSHNLIVKTDDFDLLGKIIDAGVAAGVNRVDTIQFELSDEKQAETKKATLLEMKK